MQTLNELLSQALSDNQMPLSADAQDKLIRYLELLRTWNHVFNLTAITEPKEMVYLHLIDSLAAAPFVTGQSALDVGSGAGLPGIPLAITHPERKWTTLDKNSKKTRFLTQVIAELALPNVQAIYSRCEDFRPATGFDSILSRAYGTLALFVESTEHLLNSSGIFIAMKGKYPEDELAHLPERVEIVDVKRIALKGMDVERHIVLMRKKES